MEVGTCSFSVPVEADYFRLEDSVGNWMDQLSVTGDSKPVLGPEDQSRKIT